VCEKVFRPLAHPLVLVLARLRVPPPVVVVAAGAAGLAAAVGVGRGSFLAAAGLVQLKTLLDNADGQLARLTGRTSAFGRYLDSEVDLLVNAALFAALGWTTGQPALALAGFLALTSVLSLNFNAERLARGAGAADRDPEVPATAFLHRLYGVVYGPQDRLAEWLVSRRPVLTSPRAVSLLANLGMSTQLAAFGVLLAAGHPLVFAWLALAEVAVIVPALLPQRLPTQQEAPQ
jgi:phosphatidylglycerophosphate synthase